MVNFALPFIPGIRQLHDLALSRRLSVGVEHFEDLIYGRDPISVLRSFDGA